MEYTDILYEKKDGVAKVTINRPKKMNAFTFHTWDEMQNALIDAMHDGDIGVVVITGAGDKAFCTGGDVSARTDDGYGGRPPLPGPNHLLRTMPKVTIAMVNGFAIGGGHVLHMICDLTIASETAQFGQVGPKFGSFDAGFGSAYMARLIGQKRAREMWFLCRRYTAQQAMGWGLVNWVVPPDKLEEETRKICDEILQLSPTALKALKASFNADVDHIEGIETMSSISLLQYYSSEESKEGSLAFMEKRSPDYSKWR